MSSTSFVEISVHPDLKTSTVALPHSISKTLKQHALSNADFPQVQPLEFEQHLAVFGDVVDLKAQSAIFNTVSYKLVADGYRLTLTPLILNNPLDLTFKSLSFVLPQKARPNCIAVTDAGAAVSINILTTENLLISLNLPLDSFLSQETLSPVTFYKWCQYSMPYSFDVRAPLFMRSIDPQTIIVALQDGGLLKMSRQNMEDKFLVVPFSDTSYFNQFKLPFFGSKRKDQTEMVVLDNQRVAVAAVLDFAVLENKLITLSIDKTIRFWSLETGTMERQSSLNEFLPQELHPAHFNNPPTRLLGLVGRYLTVFVPIGETSLKLFSVEQDESLILLNEYVPPNVDTWVFHSMVLSKMELNLQVSLLWSLHGARHVLLGQIDDKLEVRWAHCAPPLANNLAQSITFFDEVSLLNAHCMQLLQVYDEHVVEKVLSILEKKYNLETSGLPLAEKLQHVITHGSDPQDYLNSLKKQWVKFDNACKELSRQLEPSVGMSLVDDMLVIIKTHGLSVIVPSSPFALISYNDSLSSADLQYSNVNVRDLRPLAKYVLSFVAKFPQEVVFKVVQRVCDGSEAAELQMNTIFQEELSSFVDEAMVTELLTALNASKDTMHLFEFLIKLSTLDNVGYVPIRKVSFGNLGGTLLVSSLKNNLLLQKQLILGLLLIVLTVDINPQMVNYYTELTKLYRCVELSLQVPSYLLLGHLEDIFEGGVLVRASNLNHLLTHIFGLLLQNTFIYSIVAKLVKDERFQDAHLVKYLPETGISNILKGLILLKTKQGKEAFELFTSKVDQIIQAAKTASAADKKALQPVSDYTNLILVDSKTDYFYDLSTLFESKQFDQLALKLALKALATKTELKDISDDQAILLKVFQLALKLQEFKLAHDTILKMERKYRKHPIKQFVYKLFQMNQIPKILDYPFNEDADKVDDLIYSLGESSALNSDLKTSLKYYRICHTLRLKQGDYRAAVEALYRFNTIGMELMRQNKFNDIKLITDNYLTILNLLYTLEEDDRWIIKRPVQLVQTAGLQPAEEQKSELVYSSDLEKEYQSLMT
ncbi:hypothetical protein KL905_002168 [Ogataea polymorpha]|uniref:uncharacterized protein n=1 Tax=Ogataea polymorpha TaxID=460523 RepID=UPI0007F46BFF|nr:uncharacterized protein OGAPODRAFT_17113 [Ogataea polymorpha]KAG7909581.1 hypothetical protein KL906_002337 [Ogataea polymorpha]KAG7917103.1 hypothetical protein KL927_002877 [Ogataea polymorpha]KAG7922146.1 hypothetical protein KL905_002168 [Ogataea polymorpha]KAG7936338.1 hypothetical protein KL934_001805 [Ogataea polymorpha]OBA14206.1 hypothetical protein OGAPODRAFT_17113 [Ogataea polymorpha]